MKLSSGVLAIAAAMAPAMCVANGVTVYGVADASVSLDRSGVPGQSTGVRINSGTMQGSHLGFSGSEDLGGGIKAIFNIEMGFSLDSGSLGGVPTDSVPGAQAPRLGFNRRSVVGLESERYGTLVLGRDYTPFFRSHVQTDTFFYGMYGSTVSITGFTLSADQFVRADNGVFYTSPSLKGLVVRAMYSAGSERAAGSGTVQEPARDARMAGIGADYTAGPLLLTGAHQTRAMANGAGGTSNREDSVLAAKFTGKNFGINTGYAQVKMPGAPTPSKQVWLGGSIEVGAARTHLLAQATRMTMETLLGQAEAMTYALGVIQPLSKRTMLYASYGTVRNNALAPLPLFSGSTLVGGFVPGADPSSFAVGMRHAF